MNLSSLSSNKIQNLKNLGQLKMLIRSFERFIENEVFRTSIYENNEVFKNSLYAALREMENANEELENEVFLQK